MHQRARILLLLLLFPCATGLAQFNVTGSASTLGNDCVQLTPAANSQQGSAWNVDQIDVSLPFCIQLSVNLGSNNSGADGIAFVLHQLGPNAPSTSNGGNMGYGNYTGGTFNPPTFNPSLIIEFDTWVNGFLGDPNEDHIALQRDGTNDHTGPDRLAGPGGQRHQQQHRGWAGPHRPHPGIRNHRATGVNSME